MTPEFHALPRALVFDLDGTLIDSRRDIAWACNRTLEDEGRATLPEEEIVALVGDGSKRLVARIFDWPEEDPRTARALERFLAHYEAHPCDGTVLLPGAMDILRLGVRSALVTNKPRSITDLILEHFGLTRAFDAVWGGGDGPLKPSPEGVLGVLAKLEVSPRDAWVIGDGPQDVHAGRAAGCRTIAVPGLAERRKLLDASPDVVVESLHGIVAMLRSAGGR